MTACLAATPQFKPGQFKPGEFGRNPPTVLVTGGLGYLGSHTCVALIKAGAHVVIVDNLCNSQRDVLERIGKITGRRPRLHYGDIRDAELLDRVFDTHDIACTIHFAGLKPAGDDPRAPLQYYDTNVQGSVCLLQAMQRADVQRFVFSSSATVYGEPERVPIREDHRLRPVNPYARSKLMVEQALRDLHDSDPAWAIAILRHFNAAGAHPSGLLGEAPLGVPHNLMPTLAQVATGQRQTLRIFADDYPTCDGTGVRDYVHVMDLAEAHVRAAALLMQRPGVETINLGTGKAHSVLDVVRAYESACGTPLPHQVVGRRPGDIAEGYADPTHANERLGWTARRGLNEMCADAYRFERRQQAAPHRRPAANEGRRAPVIPMYRLQAANDAGQLREPAN